MKSNIRLLTVNCCGVHTNRAEFNATSEYVKSDLICGTESWLGGIKPDKDPDKNAIKSSAVPLSIQFIGMTEELEQVVVYSRLLKKAS